MELRFGVVMRLLSDECLGTGWCRSARVLEGHPPASASAASSPAQLARLGAPRHRGFPRPGQRVAPPYGTGRRHTNGVGAQAAWPTPSMACSTSSWTRSALIAIAAA